ncbi:tetratricopeptide repeat protein [Candidatus Margulisiibacteriota bacterium]
MRLLLCRKCNKEILKTRAISFKKSFYCPICKSRLVYLGQEISKVSGPEVLTKFDQKFPLAAKAPIKGKSKVYTNPQINEIILECEEALKHKPDNIEALMTLAKIYRQQKMPEKSITYLKIILKCDPKNQLALQNLADCTKSLF